MVPLLLDLITFQNLSSINASFSSLEIIDFKIPNFLYLDLKKNILFLSFGDSLIQ